VSVTKPELKHVIGIDFSGAKLAGENIWIARCAVGPEKLKLQSLDRLSDLVGTSERDIALPAMVKWIEQHNSALVGIDFPFGLPLELGLGDWPEQMKWVRGWTGSASDLGRECVRLCKQRVGSMHVRRTTDRETKTPFDCYHYRIIHQTFHGMREVLGALSKSSCVVPMQLDRLAGCERVIVEACPGSTLKRLGLPYQNYKSPAKPMEEKHLATRKKILAGLRSRIEWTPAQTRTMNANPGGDAMDAVIAAIGVWEDWKTCDASALRAHERYVREGRVFA
jgi:hypothetical protein